MIRDVVVRQNLENEWSTVRATWDMVAANIVFAFAGGGYVSHSFRCVSYSLTLLFACTVLEHALQQFRDEGKFACKSGFLGPLMSASRNTLPWLDYVLIGQAYVRRNDIAHHQKWIEIEECKQYIDAIEAELRAWNIVV